jgi:hypothetical protein
MHSLVLALLLLALPYSILIEKSKRELHLLKNGEVVKTYSIALGSSPIDPKEREGDRKTPEGTYWICSKNNKSNFHKSLEISYPNITDAEHGRQAHRISEREFRRIKRANMAHSEPLQHTSLGGEIYIHGGGSLRSTGRDWTWGCIALDNADIDSLCYSAGWDRSEDREVTVAERALFGLPQLYLVAFEVEDMYELSIVGVLDCIDDCHAVRGELLYKLIEVFNDIVDHVVLLARTEIGSSILERIPLRKSFSGAIRVFPFKARTVFTGVNSEILGIPLARSFRIFRFKEYTTDASDFFHGAKFS